MSRQTLIVLFSIVALVLTSVIGAWSVEKNLSTDLNNLTQASSRGKIIVVPKDFASIQSAINAANDGDIVFVDSGTYYENIVLNKSISLLGAGYSETIVDANRTSHVITVSSSNAVVAGFTFQNGGFPIPAYCGVKIDNVDNVTVSDNFISGNFVGIRLGDLQRGSNGNIVRNNIITKNRYGIFADHTNETLFYGNVVTENSWNGIEIAYRGRNTLQANNISYNMAYGLEIVSNTPSLYNRIFHNNFVNNTLKVSVSNLPQIWDDGYPNGGNYWSDYNAIDEYSGPDQNEPGSDGIADQPWVIDSNKHDRYPLAAPFTIPKSPMASFSFSPESCRVAEKITFNSSASVSHSGEIINYIWDFGDGNVATGVIMTHTYAKNGTFAVFLNVTDNNGFWGFEIKLIMVHVASDNFFINIEYVVAAASMTAFILVVAAYLVRHKRRKPPQKL